MQTKLLKYSGTTTGTDTATEGVGIAEGTVVKSSIGGSTGEIGIVGAEEGFGVGIKNIEKLGGLESKTEETEKKLGTGATGGALGGAGGTSAAGRAVASLEGATEGTYDIRRDRLKAYSKK